MRQVLLLFQHQAFWKKKKKFKTFTAVVYTSAYFHAVVKPIRQILYHFQKRCVVKAIQYENRAESFVLNGSKRPIRYESHNGVKLNWYNGNMVLKKIFFVQKSFFWTYREKNFCWLSFMLLNVSLTRVLKYKKSIFFLRVKSAEEW